MDESGFRHHVYLRLFEFLTTFSFATHCVPCLKDLRDFVVVMLVED